MIVTTPWPSYSCPLPLPHANPAHSTPTPGPPKVHCCSCTTFTIFTVIVIYFFLSPLYFSHSTLSPVYISLIYLFTVLINCWVHCTYSWVLSLITVITTRWLHCTDYYSLYLLQITHASTIPTHASSSSLLLLPPAEFTVYSYYLFTVVIIADYTLPSLYLLLRPYSHH